MSESDSLFQRSLNAIRDRIESDIDRRCLEAIERHPYPPGDYWCATDFCAYDSVQNLTKALEEHDRLLKKKQQEWTDRLAAHLLANTPPLPPEPYESVWRYYMPPRLN